MMKFEDLKLIQQVNILGNMINTPDKDARYNNVFYPVPDTAYIIDVKQVHVSRSVEICFNGNDMYMDDNYHGISISSWGSPDGDDDSDSIHIEFNMAGPDDKDGVLDRYGLLAGLLIKNNLLEGLKKISTIIASLTKLNFVAGKPGELIDRMIELIPIAQSFPSELFEQVYIDPIGHWVVDTISAEWQNAYKEHGFIKERGNTVIEDIYNGFVITDITEVNNGADPFTTRDVNIRFVLGTPSENQIYVRLYDSVLNESGVTTLCDIDVTREMDIGSLLDEIKKQTYASTDSISNKDTLTNMLDEFFTIMDKARTPILEAAVPF